jgi:hypothetical protein
MIQILSLLGGIATEFVKGKFEESKVKQEVKIKQLQSEENWDTIQAQGSQSSFKDEWFVFILSIPMIGAFVPSLVPYIEEGFRVLDSMPDYYKGFLGAAIAASFGLKSLANWKK